MSPVPVGLLTRRAFDPASLSPSFWWKADGTYWQNSARTTPATADGDPVGSFDDASGNSRHAIQATSGLRPVLRTGANGLNGHSIVSFDGSDDRLTASSILTGAAQRLFIVARKRSAPSATNEALCGFGTGVITQLLTGTLNGPNYQYLQNESNVAVSAGGSPTSWTIITYTLTSVSSLLIRMNGGAATASFDPRDAITTATAFTIGAANSGGTTPGNYDVAEVYQTAFGLTNANLDNVGNYLATKFGLAWTPVV